MIAFRPPAATVALMCLVLAGAMSACQSTRPPSAAAPISASPSSTPSTQRVAYSAHAKTFTGAQSAAADATATPGSTIRLQPCKIGSGVEIYLVVDNHRRHIADWETFLNLGYTQSDIVDCGASAGLPEGGPITRLIKGSGDPVYWMESGKRRHIPDMATFTAMGLQVAEITTLPDSIVGGWPLGDPLPGLTPPTNEPAPTEIPPFNVIHVGDFTILLFRGGDSLGDYAVISQPGHDDRQVWDVAAIAGLPATDITGEGHPDIGFLIHGPDVPGCCMGTVVYDLGDSAQDVLDIDPPPAQFEGSTSGQFKDLDGDGRYEFVTLLSVYVSSCQPISVPLVARYDPGQGKYVGAGPQFASTYADAITRLTASTPRGGLCTISPLVATLLYAGRYDDAKATFDRLYTGPDPVTNWLTLWASARLTGWYAPSAGEPDLPKGAQFQSFTVGAYTIRLFHPLPGGGLYDFATISLPGQPDIQVTDVASIDQPPIDLTGDSQPDLVFHIRGIGSGHCCWGTQVYNLGPAPEQVLSIYSSAYYSSETGQGVFQDLDGDGRYEFITRDPLKGLQCSFMDVGAILRFDACSRRYVGATPAFAAYYAGEIARLQASTQPGPSCGIDPLVTTLLMTGRPADAKAAFDRLYTGTDPDGEWQRIRAAVEGAPHYTPG